MWRMLLGSLSFLVLFVCIILAVSLYQKRRYRRLKAERQAAEEQEAKAWEEYRRMKDKLETMEQELYEFRNESETFVHNREEQLRREREAAKNAYEEMKANADGMEEKLRNMLADKETFIEEKEREIHSLRGIIENFQKEYGIFDQFNLWHADGKELAQQLRQIVAQYRKISDDEWLQVMITLKGQNPDFHAFIMRHKERLTRQELMVLVFSCLGLVPSEIRVLMDLTPQRTTNIRANINKKLFNVKSSQSMVRNVIEAYKMKEV